LRINNIDILNPIQGLYPIRAEIWAICTNSMLWKPASAIKDSHWEMEISSPDSARIMFRLIIWAAVLDYLSLSRNHSYAMTAPPLGIASKAFLRSIFLVSWGQLCKICPMTMTSTHGNWSLKKSTGVNSMRSNWRSLRIYISKGSLHSGRSHTMPFRCGFSRQTADTKWPMLPPISAKVLYFFQSSRRGRARHAGRLTPRMASPKAVAVRLSL